MQERSRSIVDIKRGNATIASVLITEGSVRAFQLMEYDYIQLEFTLAQAVYFEVGDYVDDEIFGKFVITSHQMPNYNTTTGGYDYSLRFDAEYRKWGNKVFMLTSVPADGGDRIRKETDWCLTDKLSVHLDEVIHNLNILGYTGVTYTIHETATEADEVRFIEYGGKDIITALNMMADEWNCEWWIRDNVIHMGKCEDSGSVLDFELGVNVESMDIRNNVNQYANKIFAYGSTQNIPANYRKTLVFDCTDADNGLFRDSTRDITLDMLSGTETEQSIGFGSPTQTSDTTSGVTYKITWTSVTLATANAGSSLKGDIIVNVLTNISSGVNATIRVYSEVTGTEADELYNESVVLPSPQLYREINIDKTWASQVHDRIIKVEVTISSSITSLTISNKSITSTLVLTKQGVTGQATLIFNGVSHAITFNPNGADNDSIEARYFSFDNAVPSGFGVGSQYTIDGLYTFNIPMSYYSVDYDDPSSLAKLGEVRLCLPEATGGYLIADNNLTTDQIVEQVVLFDRVMPHAIQKVSEVTATNKKSEVEQQDGSTRTWAWIQYALKATLADGNTFPFKTDYIADGLTLQIKFVTRETLESAGYTATEGAEYRLAGMTFDVNFDNTSQTYTISRNEDYGAKLPNETLLPMVGDPFVLLNWDVKAMESLGLISIAEAELQTKAQEYIDAMEQDQFTFGCSLMSDYLFGLADKQAYYNRGVPFHTSDGAQLYVAMDGNGYILPIEGQGVRIIHSALSESKTSRVIGYQFKLDKPYDTPQYNVGDTKAYSRLSQIEKQITKLS